MSETGCTTCSKHANHFKLNNQQDEEGHIQVATEHENPRFDIDEDISTTSETYEINNYGHDLDLIITSHELRLSYHMRGGCIEGKKQPM